MLHGTPRAPLQLAHGPCILKLTAFMRVSCISCFRSSPICTVPGKTMLRARVLSLARAVAGRDVKREGRLLGVTRPTRTLSNELARTSSARETPIRYAKVNDARQVACTELESRWWRRATGNSDVARCVFEVLSQKWEFKAVLPSGPRSGSDYFLFSCSADAPILSGSCTPHFDPFITGVA